MKKLVLGIIIGVILLVSIGILLSAKERVGEQSTQEALTKLRGFTFSPKSLGAQDVTDFFEQTSDADIISWHGPWEDLSATSGAANMIATNAKKYDYVPIVIVHNTKSDNAGLKTPLTDEVKADYTKHAVDFVAKHQPRYFGIGIEINRMALKAPKDFAAYTDFYPQVVSAIKAASPDTKIITTFELNTMNGMQGGLYGGTNNTSNNQWNLLEKFEEADLFAFSLYPGLLYKSPDQIPDDYLTAIASKTSKPIAITEMGWGAGTPAAGWESSETEQADFIRRFGELTSSFDYRFAIWSFVYDVDAGPAFKKMGLVNVDGSKRPGWDIWMGN